MDEEPETPLPSPFPSHPSSCGSSKMNLCVRSVGTPGPFTHTTSTFSLSSLMRKTGPKWLGSGLRMVRAGQGRGSRQGEEVRTLWLDLYTQNLYKTLN